MRALLLIGAAAVAGVAIARRKTLKDDTTRLTAAAKDGASKVNERVRGTSEETSTGETDEDAGGEVAEEEEATEADSEAEAAPVE